MKSASNPPRRKRYFPRGDPYWAQALEKAQAVIAPGDTVSAHEYFLDYFPHALPYLLLDYKSLRGVDWIILHKSSIDHPASGVMEEIQEGFEPVFANEVFVLLASRRTKPDAPRWKYNPAHVGSLWEQVDEMKIKPGRRAGILELIAAARAGNTLWPPVRGTTAEAGIVITACGRLFKELHANLSNIRARGCALPVDVWHLPGEFTPRQITALEGMAHFMEACDTPFDGLSGRHEVHGFKAWMLACSRFRKTLMLDVNSFPLTDLAAVFQSGEICILWPDAPWGACHATSSQLRRALGVPTYPLEFESGQVFVDKEAAGMQEALRLAAALNGLGRALYNYTYGDKETYSLAFDLSGVPFTIAPLPKIHPVGSVSHVDTVVFQRWLDGSPLFYHPTGAKEQWWLYSEEWAVLERAAAKAEAGCA